MRCARLSYIALLWCWLAAPAWANIALIQQNTGTGGTVSSTVSFSNPSTAGNLLVVSDALETTSFAPSFSIAGATCTGGAFTLCPASPVADSGNATSYQIAWCVLATNGTVTVTASVGSAEVQSLNMSEWSGVAASSPLDACTVPTAAANTSQGSLTATPLSTGSTGTTTGTNDLVIGGVGQQCTNCSITTGSLTLGYTPLLTAATTGETAFTVYQIAGTSPPPPTCSQTIPGTSIGVGSSCMPNADFPTLNNPHDPINFDACVSNPTGCKNGTQDITGALNAAYVAGTDVKINTPGTYLLNDCQDCTGSGSPWSYCSGSQTCSLSHVNTSQNGQLGFQPPASTTLECASGVTIKTTRNPPRGDGAILEIINNNVNIIGCTFQGAAGTSPVPANFTGGYLIAPSGSTNTLIEGDTFTNFAGQAAVETLPENGANSNATTTNLKVKYNNFQNLAFYGFVVASNISTASIDHNVVTDSALGAEWDACTSGTVGTGILFANNYVKSVAGDCLQATPACNSQANGGFGASPGYIPVGNASPTCNYNGVTIGGSTANENYCVGTNGKPISYGAVTDGASGTATETNNILDTGCTCNSGTGSC